MDIRSITAPNPGAFTLDGTRSYILGSRTIIDPGPDIASHVDALAAAAPDLELILITHRHADHAPAAMSLRRKLRARVCAPEGVLDRVDQRLSGGETIVVEGAEIRVIATPGHTREHVCYLTEDGDLFTGDTVLGSGTTAIFPPDGNMSDYLRSLRLLRDLEPRRIFPAHGPTREDAVALLDEYIAHRLAREAQIVDELARGGHTIPQLREAIYPGLDHRLHRAAEVQLLAHLIKLGDEGRAVLEGDVYRRN